jgi:hypothetical protein
VPGGGERQTADAAGAGDGSGAFPRALLTVSIFTRRLASIHSRIAALVEKNCTSVAPLIRAERSHLAVPK